MVKNLYISLIICIVATTLSIQTLCAQSVGLALAGGGARGIAHIGMMQALEDNNVPIDYIAGTSMGAIVGALYAMGYTPAEMMEIITSPEYLSIQSGQTEEEYRYYFKQRDASGEITSFKLSLNDSTNQIKSNILHSSLINTRPLNFGFMKYFGANNAQSGGDFDQLYIPFRAVAADIYKKREVVLSKGHLGDAVRASMSFPVLYKPIEIDGSIMYDGGIYNNFPVSVVREEFAPDIIIGSDLTSENETPLQQGNIIADLQSMIIDRKHEQILPEDGILLTYPLDNYGLLDGHKAQEIYQIGYDRTMEEMERIKELVQREVEPHQRALDRVKYRGKTPELRFGSIRVEGGNEGQKSYLEREFAIREGESSHSIEEVKRIYFKVLSDNKIDDLKPYAVYNEDTEMFDLLLKADVSDKIALGIGTYISSGTANSVYLSSRYETVNLYSMDAELSGQLGRTYNGLTASARIELPTELPTYMQLLSSYSSKQYYESEHLFYDDEVPTFITQREFYTKLNLGIPFMHDGKATLSVGYGILHDFYYPTNNIDFSSTTFDESQYNLVMVGIQVEKNRLNAIMYPSTGYKTTVTAEAVTGTEQYEPNSTSTSSTANHSWAQLTTAWQHYYSINKKFTLGVNSELMISNKGLFDNYTATMLQAPAFTPTPHSQTVFNEAFSAHQYLAAGAIPIWHITSGLQLRSELYAFVPYQRIRRDSDNMPYYDTPLSSISYMSDLSLVYALPFASFGLWVCNYSFPTNNWQFGISLGVLMYNPSFIK